MLLKANAEGSSGCFLHYLLSALSYHISKRMMAAVLRLKMRSRSYIEGKQFLTYLAKPKPCLQKCTPHKLHQNPGFNVHPFIIQHMRVFLPCQIILETCKARHNYDSHLM